MVVAEVYCGMPEQNSIEKWKDAIEEILGYIYFFSVSPTHFDPDQLVSSA